MATKKATALATSYLKGQVEIMKKYGEAPKASGPRFAAAVKQVAETLDSILAR